MRFYRFLKRRPFLRMTRMNGCWIPCNTPGRRRLFHPSATAFQREYDKDLYKARHLIESFFQKLKQFRAIATRYDKLAQNFLAGIHLAAACIWLN